MAKNEADNVRARRGAAFWFAWFGILLAVALYAYAIWSAIGNIILLPQSAAGFGLTVGAYGWFWLILQLSLPAIIAGVALILGRKKTLPLRAIILLSGVAALSVFSIDMANSIPVTTYFG